MARRHDKSMKGAGTLGIVLGALVILTPFFTGDLLAAALWNSVLVGATVVVLASYNTVAANRGQPARAFGSAAANLVLGAWILISGFVLVVSAAYTTMYVVFGLALAASAGYNTWVARHARRHKRPVA